MQLLYFLLNFNQQGNDGRDGREGIRGLPGTVRQTVIKKKF